MENTDFRDLVDTVVPNLEAEDLMFAGLQAMIASEITIRRQKLGMTQEELARRLGVSQGLVSRWENGDANFTLKTLVLIASKLNIQMQSPFKLSLAKAEYFNDGKIIFWTPPSAYHVSGQYIPSESYSTADDAERAKEM